MKCSHELRIPLAAAVILAVATLTNWGNHHEPASQTKENGKTMASESRVYPSNHERDYRDSSGVAGYETPIGLFSRSNSRRAQGRTPISRDVSEGSQGTQETPAKPLGDSNVGGTDRKRAGVSNDFEITAYTSGYESSQKKPGENGYGITATGTVATEGRTIAADWSVLPPGTVVEIQGLPGEYTVEDKGGAVQGNFIDLYMQSVQAALDWGRQHREVTIIQMGTKNE